MRDKDADEIKLKRDAMEREEMKKKVEEAREKTGDLKLQIFEEQKKKELEMKKAEEEKIKLNQVKPPEKAKVVEGQGSVWNNYSYHWEQKSVDKWSQDTLNSVLSLFQFKFEKATLRITEVKDLKGESSVSIRKGKKIVTYEYSTKLVWKCDMGDETNTKVVASIDGEYVLPEISSDILDDGEEWEVQCSIKNGDEQLIKTLYQVVKKFAPDALRKTIKTSFVEELKKK